MNKNSSKKRDFPLPRRKESEPGGTGPDGPRRGGGAAIQPFQSDQADDQARARTLPPASKGAAFRLLLLLPVPKCMESTRLLESLSSNVPQ